MQTNETQGKYETPLPLDWLLAKGTAVTQEHLEAAKQAGKYPHRDRIPEPLLRFTDLYNELTGQEPTVRSLSDWISTAEEWKAERLTDESIRAAWRQSQDINKGFHVGRPGALTVTAIAICNKERKPVTPVQINTKRIEDTKQALDEKWNMKFVPRPANVKPPKFKKGQDPT